MKNIFYSILVISLVISCKSNVKTSIKVDSLSTGKTPEKTKSVIENLGPFFYGVWVKSSYIEDIAKTKSPYSTSELGGVASFQIGKLGPKDDSTNVGYSLNNHEGSDFVLYLKTGHKPTSLKTNLPDYDVKSNFFELGYTINNKDTVLMLYHYNKSNHIIDSTRYSKVADEAKGKNDAAWGIQYTTNKTLFTGKYISTDTTGTTSKVQFTNDGKVSGLMNFKDYYINTDFSATPEDDFDEIIFDLYGKKDKLYSFKINADTLNLYDAHYNADSTKLLLGKRAYKLVKQK